MVNKATDLLNSKKLKKTKNRIELLNLLAKKSPLTAEDIFSRIDKTAGSLSTVYRNLSVLVDKGILIKTVGHNFTSYYQLNTFQHKHQVLCQGCQKLTPIDFCPMHEFEAELEKRTGFEIVSHNFEFVGLCPDCQKKEKGRHNR